MPWIELGGRIISEHSLPYIIAEIGVNHEGSLEKAKELVSLAKEGGADAVKFQSYKAETLAVKRSPAYWDTSKEPATSQYELFKKYDAFGEKEYIELADYCRSAGIDFVSTPFDDAAIEFLNPVVPFFKIASADITNTPLIRKIAEKGKPVVLSTGASTLAEIDMAVEELRGKGSEEIALLHCVLSYPTAPRDANLGMISGLQRAYPDLLIGYSDHTPPDEMMLVLTAAYLKGARIIEKHFTDDKKLAGNDHYHAMDSEDLKKFKENVAQLFLFNGLDHKHPISSEGPSRRNARRSITLKQALSGGTIIHADMITCKRPGHGISPLCWDEVIGRATVRDLPEDHQVLWSDLGPIQDNRAVQAS